MVHFGLKVCAQDACDGHESRSSFYCVGCQVQISKLWWLLYHGGALEQRLPRLGLNLLSCVMALFVVFLYQIER